MLIEDTVSGAPLIQELREMNWAVRAYGVKPSMEKEARAAAQSVKFELGHVYIAADKEWTAALVDELLAFPRSRRDDQVDSVVQYLGFQVYDDAPGFGGYYLGGKD